MSHASWHVECSGPVSRIQLMSFVTFEHAPRFCCQIFVPDYCCPHHVISFHVREKIQGVKPFPQLLHLKILVRKANMLTQLHYSVVMQCCLVQQHLV